MIKTSDKYFQNLHVYSSIYILISSIYHDFITSVCIQNMSVCFQITSISQVALHIHVPKIAPKLHQFSNKIYKKLNKIVDCHSYLEKITDLDFLACFANRLVKNYEKNAIS